jgi:hypothetical protein
MHKLRGGDILGYGSGDKCVDLPDLSGRYDIAYLE